MDAKITGCFIAQLRKELGLTQKELAEKLEVTDKAISRWETGKGLPDTSLLKPLAEIFGVSVGELLSGKRMDDSQIKSQADHISAMRKDRKNGKEAYGMCFWGYWWPWEDSFLLWFWLVSPPQKTQR